MGTINVNLIADNGGGSNVTVQGEGTNTTILAQGLAKVLASFDGSSSGFLGSFNCSGITDHGTGDHTVTYTNSMSNDDYAHPFHFGGTSGQGVVRTGGRGVNTGTIGIVGTNGAQTSAQDVTVSGVAVFGDLA